MTPDQIVALITVAAFALTLGKVFIDIGSLKTKVDVMWQFQMQRAAVQAVEVGHAKKNSPLQILPEAIAMLNPVADQLKRTFGLRWRKLSADELTFEIQADYGQVLNDRFCLPFKLKFGECLLYAAAVASGVDIIDIGNPLPVIEAYEQIKKAQSPGSAIADDTGAGNTAHA